MRHVTTGPCVTAEKCLPPITLGYRQEADSMSMMVDEHDNLLAV